MAKFKVNHEYKDVELKKILIPGNVVDMTVKRAEYVNKNNKNKVKFLTRLPEEEDVAEEIKEEESNEDTKAKYKGK